MVDTIDNREWIIKLGKLIEGKFGQLQDENKRLKEELLRLRDLVGEEDIVLIDQALKDKQ